MKPLTETILDVLLETPENVLDNGYRYGSDMFMRSLLDAKARLNESDLSEVDREILSTDIGTVVEIDGVDVPLDLPLYEEVELNSPKRGGNKKYYVYVKNEKGNVIKVEFGAPDMSVKFTDPQARKSFNARHKCSDKKDKTTPGYWSCRLPYYAKQLGLSGGGNFYW